MTATKKAMRAAKKAEGDAEMKTKEEAALAREATSSGSTCANCADLKREIAVLEAERRQQAKAAGASAKMARDARGKITKVRQQAQEKQEAASLAKTTTIEKSNAVLARLARDQGAL